MAQCLENYIVSVLMVLYYTAAVSSSSEVFIIEPQDVTADKGDNVTFSCSVKKMGRTSISWNVVPDQKKLERNEEFHHHLTSTLIVQDIDQYDHYIACTVSYASDTSGQYQWRNFSSRRAKLRVQQFPTSNMLICTPKNAISILEGELIQVHCAVDRCKPTVDLNWRLEPQKSFELPLPRVNDDGLVRNLFGEVVVSQKLHNSRIMCIVTSELAFPGRSLECPIGPIKVLTPPTINVHPRNEILEDYTEIRFTCTAEGYPQVFNFSWSCSSTVELNGCTGSSISSNMSVVHISTSSGPSDTEYAIITCTATNTVGSSTYSSNLMIKQRKVATLLDQKTTTHESCPHGKLLSISLQQQEPTIKPTNQMAFWCNVTGHNLANIERKWYYRSLLITDDEKDFFKEDVSMSTFVLHFLNISKAQNGKEVICEVTLCGQTVRSSVNLSIHQEQIQSKLSESESHLMVSLLGTPTLPTNSQPNKLAMWKIIAMASAGVLVTIMLTACVVAVVSILLYKHLSKSNTETSTSGLKGPTCEELPTGRAVYEVASAPVAAFINIPTTSTESDETSNGSLQDTYASEIVRDSFSSTPPQSSSWTSSSDAYMGISPPGKENAPLPSHLTHPLNNHMYVNHDIVKMHEL